MFISYTYIGGERGRDLLLRVLPTSELGWKLEVKSETKNFENHSFKTASVPATYTQPRRWRTAVFRSNERFDVSAHQTTYYHHIYGTYHILGVLLIALPGMIYDKICTNKVSCACVCMKCKFFAEYKTFALRPRVFSRALGCGARRGPACTPPLKCGSRRLCDLTKSGK